MRHRTPLFLPFLLLLAGCKSSTDTYAPPAQRQPLDVPAKSGALGYFVAMSDPMAGAYVVKDIADTTEGGAWRWTYKRPELRFFIPPNITNLKYTMDFSFPERIFKETGPVTLTFHINGKVLDKVRIAKGGQQHYEKPVPPEMLRPGTENFVAIEPDKVWTSKTDGAVLGFILSRAGFTE